MVATIKEMWRGISGGQDSRTIKYVVENVGNDQDAISLTENASPITYDLLPRSDVTVEEVQKNAYEIFQWGGPGDVVEQQDGLVEDGTYYTSAHYTRNQGQQAVPLTGDKPSQTDTNTRTYAFEQSLTNVQLFQSPIGVAPKFYDTFTDDMGGTVPPVEATGPFQYMGINEVKGEVKGESFRQPVGGMSLDYYPSKSLVTRTYQRNMTKLVASVNNAVFFDYQIGEVMLVSVRGNERNTADWHYNFRFEIRENVFSTTVGLGADRISYAREGWQYAWVKYQEEVRDNVGTTKKAALMIPTEVIIETIYPKADFNTIFPSTFPTP